MHRSFPFLLALAFVAVLAASPVRGHLNAQPAQAADVWSVQVGGDVEVGPAHATAIAFFPAIIEVRVGDTVEWNFVPTQDPHTTSFLAGQPPPDEGFIPSPNGEITFGAALFPFGAVGPNATYDGTAQISSGIPEGPDTPPFRITLTGAGIFDYLCLVHGPSMSGQVRVLPAGSALRESPEQERARGQTDFQQLVDDLRQAIAGEGEGPPPLPPVTTAAGTTIYPVAAGASLLSRFSALAGLVFEPADLTVHRGDVVVWTAADPNEIHTISFTSGGQVPEFVDVRPQPDGPPQLVIPANVAGPVGGQTYNGTGYLNSGILFLGRSFSVVIDAPPGRYDYQCLVHPTVMKGSITVTP